MKTVYFDCETDSQYPAYCNLTILGLLWGDGTEEIFTAPFSKEEFVYLQTIFADKNIRKVGFNNLNFDNLVMYRHGIPVCEENCEDGYLAAKTLWPEMPSFSLKFLNWWLFADRHWPEYELLKATAGMTASARFAAEITPEMETYNAYDLQQHKNLWEYVEPKLIGRAKDAYNLDMSQGKVIEQMIFKGGLHLDKAKCIKMIRVLEKAKANSLQITNRLTGGAIENLNSNRQLGAYFTSLGYELDHTASGEFQVDKETIDDLWKLEPVAKCVKNIRKADSILKYYKNYIKALADTTHPQTQKEDWIPVAFSISGARSRRYTSSSKHGLNFQNPSANAKKVQIIPPGWLGFWIDATQIENVVHIYESKDTQRRQAYEDDPDWSEYVWLCNTVLGTSLGKKELDKIKSPNNELWSVYKEYKTVKLMMNFGAGIRKFCNVTGFPYDQGKKTFGSIHRACPAIRRLQKRVQSDFETKGEVYDVFGHVYRTFPDAAFKLVAYLIQGCGTGSLPKAQLRANYNTLQKYGEQNALLCGTTHDECAGRLKLSLGRKKIETILSEMLFNMTMKFSPKFDNIPLRAKLYLSTTGNSDRIECKSYTEYLAKNETLDRK